jgi:uncharacterized membrane protein
VESFNRVFGDNAVSTLVKAEVSARDSADLVLSAALKMEAVQRIAADENLMNITSTLNTSLISMLLLPMKMWAWGGGGGGGYNSGAGGGGGFARYLKFS